MKRNATLESSEDRSLRAKSIYVSLKKAYPEAKIALKYGNSWELLVSVILSAQCTDKMVNIVTKNLFQKYKTLNDYVNAKSEEFEQNIKSTGFYRQKTKNILATANIIKNTYKGKVPDTMEALVSLPGVARKTANIILANAFRKIEGVAVDTHVLRISQRLKIVPMEAVGGKKEVVFEKNGKRFIDYKKDANPEKVEYELMKVLSKDTWFPYTYYIIEHGRALCKARNPECGKCPINQRCPSSRN